MNYEQFLITVKDHISSSLDENTSVILHKVLKNNGLTLDSLSIMEAGSHISPAIYLNDYYYDYQNGISIEKIAADIRKLYSNSKSSIPFCADEFKDFKKIKGKIAYKLINYAANKKLLAAVPHKPLMDLALVFYVLVHQSEEGCSSVLIRDEHLKLWNIDKNELLTLAKQNTPLLFQPELTDMNTLLCEFMEENSEISEEFGGIISSPTHEFVPMYVLTNHIRVNGASVMLYDDILSSFAHKLQHNLFILPSSIHEVILVPDNSAVSKESLMHMVKEVNEKEVSDIERLSDQVYYFDRKTKSLSM